ncbi:MAG: UbiA family prenyltransferase [Thermoanaerobaculia bacterium]
MEPPEATTQQTGGPHARTLARYAGAIRFDEVIVLQGAPLLGAFLAVQNATVQKTVSLALLSHLTLFAAASCLLIAHIFVLNDWSEMSLDAGEGGIAALDRTATRHLWLFLLVVSLLLFGWVGFRAFSIAAAIAALSALYSAQPWQSKGIPVLNSSIHLVGGLLHFLLGYALFMPIDRRGVVLGLFFALTFVAGHLMQEVRDHDRDSSRGIATNAVRFGKRRAFAAGLWVFTIADLLLVTLVLGGVLPRVWALVAGLYPAHLYWSFRALSADLTSASVRRLQWRYRSIYAGVALVAVIEFLVR